MEAGETCGWWGLQSLFSGHSQPFPKISGFPLSLVGFRPSSYPAGWAGLQSGPRAPFHPSSNSFLPPSPEKRVGRGKSSFSSKRWAEVTLQLERKPNPASSSLSGGGGGAKWFHVRDGSLRKTGINTPPSSCLRRAESGP